MDHLASRDVARLLEHGRAFERPDMWSRPLAVDRLLESVADLVPGDIAVITVTTEDLSFRTYAPMRPSRPAGTERSTSGRAASWTASIR